MFRTPTFRSSSPMSSNSGILSSTSHTPSRTSYGRILHSENSFCTPHSPDPLPSLCYRGYSVPASDSHSTLYSPLTAVVATIKFLSSLLLSYAFSKLPNCTSIDSFRIDNSFLLSKLDSARECSIS